MNAPAHNPTQLADVPANFVHQANALHAEISGALRSALLKARRWSPALTAVGCFCPDATEFYFVALFSLRFRRSVRLWRNSRLLLLH